MKKATYEKPNLQVQFFVVEDVVRTSGNSLVGSDNAVFEGYESEAWN